MPFAPLADINMCYETHGDPSHSAIILIMGFGGQLIQWPPELIDTLVSTGHYVITFDNRDAGETTFHKPPQEINLQDFFAQFQEDTPPALPYTLHDMAQDVLQLMDFLNLPRAHILGMSLGGMIAQLLAIHHPERLLSLICLSTSSGDPRLPPPSSEVQSVLMDFTQPSNNSAESHRDRRFKIYKIYNPEHTQKDLEQAKELAKAEYQRRQPGNSLARQILAVTTAPSRLEELKNVTIKTLIIHGTEDPVFSLGHGKQLHQLIKESHLVQIPHMGHGFTQESLGDVESALIQSKILS